MRSAVSPVASLMIMTVFIGPVYIMRPPVRRRLRLLGANFEPLAEPAACRPERRSV
jgi:hypothetical protein